MEECSISRGERNMEHYSICGGKEYRKIVHIDDAFLQRNLKKCSSSIKSLAYFTYVRPILEYASIVWAPHTNCQIVTLEKIHRRTARFVCNNYSKYDSVTDILTLLNWASLEQRRNQAKCIMFYKILNNTRGPTRFQITYALVEISFQNTKSVFKTQISFQNANPVFKTQIQFSKHKSPLKYTKSVFKS